MGVASRPGPDIALLQECRPPDLEVHAPDWMARQYRCVGLLQPRWRLATSMLVREPLIVDALDPAQLGPPERRWFEHLPWRSSGWNNNRNVTLLLEQMVLRGEVAAAGRSEGGKRLWDLAERIYPDDPPAPADEARRVRNEKRLGALGIARAQATDCPVERNDVGDAGEPAVIGGVRGEWRVDPAQLGQPFAGRLALLSPLDRLVYDRKRMAELFEFDYQLEMFKPNAKRSWGYYALPILSGDRLVGKVDATAEYKTGVLRVDAIHRDTDFTKAQDADLDRELRDLAAWLQLDLDIA
jgi:uncharacterized protein